MFWNLFQRSKNQPTISPEKAQEYREVAGLVCLDIDLLEDLANVDSLTVEDLRWQIKDVAFRKKQIIRDRKFRRELWESNQMIFGAVAAGLVRTEQLAKDFTAQKGTLDGPV